MVELIHLVSTSLFLRWLWGQVFLPAVGDLSHFLASLCLLSSLIKWFGVALANTIWRVEQLIKVKVLKNFSCFFFVILCFRFLSTVLLALLLFAWADSLANEAILISRPTELRMFEQLIKTVRAIIIRLFFAYFSCIVATTNFWFKFWTLLFFIIA